MSEQDKLLEEGRKLHAAWFDGPDMERTDRMIRMAKVAREIHKPRTVTTAEELDALAEGSMILDADPDALLKDEDGRWLSLHDADNVPYSSAAITFPATVLYEPTA